MTLPAVQTWLDEGTALKARLLAERAELTQRLTEIDAALEKLGAESSGPSVPRQVLAVLERAAAPMKVSEIQHALPRVSRLAIGSAVHHLAKRGEIQATGRKGGQRYSVAMTGGGTPA